MNKIVYIIFGVLLLTIASLASAQHVIPVAPFNYTNASSLTSNVAPLAPTGCPTNNGITGLFITNLSSNTLPWNTSVSALTGNNPMNVTCLITYNLPWAFPFITFVLMIMTDYLLATKTGVDKRSTFIAVAALFMILTYFEVIGSLTNVSYFFVFAFIMVIAGFLVLLFTPKNE